MKFSITEFLKLKTKVEKRFISLIFNFQFSIPAERGVILYLSLVIMGILLSLALGVNSILLSQTKMIKDIGDSVLAFYAAETGIEKNLLYDGSQGPGSLENGATYSVTTFVSDVKSVGTYKTTNRAIYISR